VKTTGSDALLEQLASQHRRVAADWRALILLRRATFDLAPYERRWTQLPREPADLTPLLRQMRRRHEISPLERLPFLCEVTVPYARHSGPLDEDEVLFEANPYAVLSHLSALTFHGLSDDLPKRIIVTVSRDGRGDLLPLGTEPRDWEGILPAAGRKPALVLGRLVHWMSIKPEWFFGFAAYQPRGYPIRVTTPERTLLDGLQAPELSGGIENVLRAWASARDMIDLDRLVSYVDRFDIGILRQRAGFVLDELGLVHPGIDEWRHRANRGGSSRLVGAAPYAPRFSEPWNLSLNGPVAMPRDSAP